MRRLLVAVVLVALTGACTGGDESATSGTGPDTSAPTSAPAPDVDPEPLTPTGTLRIGFATGLQTFDPAQAGAAQITYLRPVFDSLFAVEPDGEVVGRVVEDYELTPEQLVLELRDGIEFSDGEPVDAEAVAANLERTRGAGGQAAAAFARVASVDATGPMEVTIALSGPAPTLPNDLAGLAGMVMSPTALAGPDVATDPVGSGPWVLESVAPGDRVVYALNPDHWDPEAQGVERIEVLELPDNNARTNALLSEQVDMAQLVAPQLAAVRAADLEVLSFPDVYYGLLILDRAGTMVPALANPLVRQALQHAIDRDTIIEHVFFGAGTASPQPYPEGRTGHVDDLEAFTFDPDRARELLAEAGYADGFSLRIPTIAPLQSFAEAIAGYLGDVGIAAEIEVLQPGTLAAAAQSGDYPMFVGPGALVDPLQWHAGYFAPTGVWNPFGAAVPGVDDAAAALAAAAGDDRAEAAADLVGAVVSDGVLVTVGLADLLVGANDGVDVPGWQYDPFPDVRGIRLGT